MPTVLAKTDLAWNGHTFPEATTLATFTPFYVPPGAKAYDSSSPLILYTGRWSTIFSSGYIQKSIHSTSEARAAISFTFTGTGIEWFGNCDRNHGVSLVYINGFKHTVDAFCDHAVARKQQRIFWKFDLVYGRHTLKIINTAKGKHSKRPTLCDLDAFVVTRGNNSKLQASSRRNTSLNQTLETGTATAQWTLIQKGATGVSAMQLSIISESHALMVDKVEHNPLTINGHPAWAALYNLRTHAVKPLAMQSNSFCAGGAFLGNGTLVNVGGNPVVEDHTSAADFGDIDGLQSIRIFEPCDSESVDSCEMYENHSRIRMASPRWYNTVVRISDGSVMIIGGSKRGGWINNATVNNPTIEYFPPKGIHKSNGLPIHMPFFVETLNSNLFPIAFSLPDGRVFMAANRNAIIYDWKNNKEQKLPQIPNGVRVTYPMAGTALLLPLSPKNRYQAEVLICGGSTIQDDEASYKMSSQDPASSQCSRLVLTDEGITQGWRVELMPHARTMPDAVLLPTGDILIVNGAATGISGYGNVLDQVGSSNADHPVLTPVLYMPSENTGKRFSSAALPTSHIPRMYHSVASLTPSGDVMVAGSNPNLDRSETKFGTEYRVEWFSPPYMQVDRPKILENINQVEFGQKIEVKVQVLVNKVESIKVALMDLGFVTHAVHANSRLVYLECSINSGTLTFFGPPNGDIYPPGPGWVYLLVDGIPSEGVKTIVGSGSSPPVDEDALENLLKKTSAAA